MDAQEDDAKANTPPTKAKKPPTTFASLPAELRTYIYDLSGYLKILQCKVCHSTVRGDDEDISYRSCCFYDYDDYEMDCEYRQQAVLWVNRKSRSGNDDCGRHIGWVETHSMEDHLDEHVVSIAQPALSRVSKQLRHETLSIFYGNHIWNLTVSKDERVSDAPCAWLERIGPANAALVKKIMIVLPDTKDAEGRLKLTWKVKQKLHKCGYHADVLLMPCPWGFCRCETCVSRRMSATVPKEQ